MTCELVFAYFHSSKRLCLFLLGHVLLLVHIRYLTKINCRSRTSCETILWGGHVFVSKVGSGLLRGGGTGAYSGGLKLCVLDQPPCPLIGRGPWPVLGYR